VHRPPDICSCTNQPNAPRRAGNVQGCDIMCYPGAFNMTTGPLHWELLQRARWESGASSLTMTLARRLVLLNLPTNYGPSRINYGTHDWALFCPSFHSTNDFLEPRTSIWQTHVHEAAMLPLPLCLHNATHSCSQPMHWRRANDNQMYVAAISPARDETAGYVAWGHSTVVDPW